MPCQLNADCLDKIFEFLGLLFGVEQVEFGGERQPLQIVQCAERIGIEAVFAKQLAVVSGERQNQFAQIAPEPFGLQLANRSFRQLLPSVLEQVRIQESRPSWPQGP